jgi:hypothetical protein
MGDGVRQARRPRRRTARPIARIALAWYESSEYQAIMHNRTENTDVSLCCAMASSCRVDSGSRPGLRSLLWTSYSLMRVSGGRACRREDRSRQGPACPRGRATRTRQPPASRPPSRRPSGARRHGTACRVRVRVGPRSPGRESAVLTRRHANCDLFQPGGDVRGEVRPSHAEARMRT